MRSLTLQILESFAGEWYGVDPNVIEADAMVTHKPNFVPSYTAPLLNGLPGPLYNGSHGRQFFPNKMKGMDCAIPSHALASR